MDNPGNRAVFSLDAAKASSEDTCGLCYINFEWGSLLFPGSNYSMWLPVRDFRLMGCSQKPFLCTEGLGRGLPTVFSALCPGARSIGGYGESIY